MNRWYGIDGIHEIWQRNYKMFFFVDNRCDLGRDRNIIKTMLDEYPECDFDIVPVCRYGFVSKKDAACIFIGDPNC